MKVYFSIKGFERRSSLFTWLHRIAVNLSIEFLRKRKAATSFDSAPRELKRDRSQLSADPVLEGQIRTANKNFEPLIFLNDNSLSKPERSEQAYRPERWESMRHKQAWWTLTKERD